MKARIIYRPNQQIRPGAIVIAKISPWHSLETHVTGFTGHKLNLADWSHPVRRQKVRVIR